MIPSLQGVRSAARQSLSLGRFLAARAAGRKHPFMVTMSLTDRCNFRCEYCKLPVMDRPEMTTAEWFRAVDELADAGMGRASLMGGEPLVRKDVGKILRRLKSRGVNVAMNTNGWLVPQRIDELAGLDLACITLDGPPSVHDAQRHPGSYDRALKAIEALRGRGINVVTMTVLTPRGVETVDHVLAVAKAMGTLAYFQLVHDAWGDPDKEIGAGIADAGIVEVARHLLRRKEEGAPVGPSRTYLRALIGDGEHGARRLDACEDCYASRYFVSITPTGHVIPCPLTFRGDALDGKAMGFAKAFEALAQPTSAGCSCYPTQEMNNVLRLQPEVIFNALSGVIFGRPEAIGELPTVADDLRPPPRRRLPLAQAEALAETHAQASAQEPR
jgi:MoaA/NifB/PqqE/SkfB family radical SAM enzyme